MSNSPAQLDVLSRRITRAQRARLNTAMTENFSVATGVPETRALVEEELESSLDSSQDTSLDSSQDTSLELAGSNVEPEPLLLPLLLPLRGSLGQPVTPLPVAPPIPFRLPRVAALWEPVTPPRVRGSLGQPVTPLPVAPSTRCRQLRERQLLPRVRGP